MSAGSQGEDTGEDDEMRQKGLVGGHSYTIIAVYEEVLLGKLTKIIKLRNPWGNFEWNGRFNENSSVWMRESAQPIKKKIEV